MDDIAEKRVYADAAGRVTLHVACALGVVTVHAHDGRVGEFGVAERCDPAAIAAGPAGIAVATADDVLIGPDAFAATGFGPATAVGVDGDRVIAAAPDGRVAALDDEWVDLGTLDGVTAIDAGLVAARSGVHRAADGLPYVGLEGVRDVAANGPLAATPDGLYALGNGWMRVLDADVHVVAASPGGPAHAATRDTLYERTDAGEWTPGSLPVDDAVLDVAYADCPYALTATGDLVSRPDPGGWRLEPLGLDDAVGIAAR